MTRTAIYTFLMASMFMTSRAVIAGDIDIRIKNRGSTNIYVAVAKVGGVLDATHVEGWYTVNPSSWMDPIIVSGSSGYTYYLAFAIKNKNGDFGHVSYYPTERGAVSRANRFYAVSVGGFERRGSDSAMRIAPQGYTTIPFTVEIDTGRYGDHNVTVEVSPSSNDKFNTVLYVSEMTRKDIERNVEKVVREKLNTPEMEAKLMSVLCEAMGSIVEVSVSERDKGKDLAIVKKESSLDDKSFEELAYAVMELVYQRPHLEPQEEKKLFINACSKDIDSIGHYKEHRKSLKDVVLEKLGW